MTTLAHGRHSSFTPMRGEGEVVWKVGSLQAFVDTAGETSDNFGCQVYATADVHRIGCLDVRIANFDRNYGNMLVRAGRTPDGSRSLKLVPIDHGCSLPDRLQLCSGDIAWMSWPQAKQPFGEEELRHIASLDGVADARLLNESLGLERDCLRLLEVLTRWLQVAASRGLTLYDIGLAYCRDDASLDSPSAVENVIASSISTAFAAAKCQSSSEAGASAGMRPTLEIYRVASAGVSNEPCRVTASCARSVGIFEELEWTPLLEDLFRRHVGAALERLANSRAPPPSPVAEPPLASNVVGVESNCMVEPIFKRSARAYVPPQMRRQLAAERQAAENHRS